MRSTMSLHVHHTTWYNFEAKTPTWNDQILRGVENANVSSIYLELNAVFTIIIQVEDSFTTDRQTECI